MTKIRNLFCQTSSCFFFSTYLAILLLRLKGTVAERAQRAANRKKTTCKLRKQLTTQPNKETLILYVKSSMDILISQFMTLSLGEPLSLSFLKHCCKYYKHFIYNAFTVKKRPEYQILHTLLCIHSIDVESTGEHRLICIYSLQIHIHTPTHTHSKPYKGKLLSEKSQ